MLTAMNNGQKPEEVAAKGLKDRSKWTPQKLKFVEVKKANGGTSQRHTFSV
jgi:hypothetical protein